jgi:hypothetical protein
VNFGGHVAVAARHAPERPRFWLGSALPDFAAMGRFRLLGSCAIAEVADGIAFHHRTDTAFHGHSWFTGRMAALRNSLDTDGLSRGAARAVAHVGPELLLDGRLLLNDDQPMRFAIDEIAPLIEQLLPLVDSEAQTAFAEHLHRVVEYGTPTNYHQPSEVATRLHRILTRRPRLTFDESQLTVVELRLTAIQPSINDTALDLVDELVDQLAKTQRSF